LTAVISIIGVLAAILLPALARARESARRASCLNNLSEIGIALQMYAAEHEGALPWSGGGGNAQCLLDFWPNYVTSVDSFVCPSDGEPWNRGRRGDDKRGSVPDSFELDGEWSIRGSYDYFGAYTRAPIVVPTLPAPIPVVPIMWDICGTTLAEEEGKSAPGRFGLGGVAVSGVGFNHVPGGGNVLWLDGSVTFERAADWVGWNLPYRPDAVAFDPPRNFLPSKKSEEQEDRFGPGAVFRPRSR
jgi:prepilin-type processing-associated H-X9-DG protein